MSQRSKLPDLRPLAVLVVLSWALVWAIWRGAPITLICIGVVILAAVICSKPRRSGRWRPF